MPTTISSGVALVSTAKGSVALALLLTVTSNLLGVLTVPFMLALLLSVDGVAIDPIPLLFKLTATILMPLAVGKGAREGSRELLAYCTRRKSAFSLVSNVMIALIVWMNLSVSAAALMDVAAKHLISLLLCGA